jgi:hypothetical protein
MPRNGAAAAGVGLSREAQGRACHAALALPTNTRLQKGRGFACIFASIWNAAAAAGIGFVSLRISPHAGSGSLSSVTPKGLGLFSRIDQRLQNAMLDHGLLRRRAMAAQRGEGHDQGATMKRPSINPAPKFADLQALADRL